MNLSLPNRVLRAMTRPRESTARIAAAMLQTLPSDFVAGLKSNLRPVGRLDYAPKRIMMYLNSPWQVFRLRSCAKEPETVRWLEDEFHPGDCFYDIGANVGAYSLVAFAITEGKAKIVAFEPGFATFTELCRNIELNNAQASIIPLSVALSDRRGVAAFRYSDTTPGAAQHSWYEGAIGEKHAPALVLPTIMFELDDLIADLDLPPPTLLKLDVDGPELEVLLGAERTLSRPSLRSVLVELDDRNDASTAVVARIESKGFRIRSRHVHGGSGPVQNVIFVRPD